MPSMQVGVSLDQKSTEGQATMVTLDSESPTVAAVAANHLRPGAAIVTVTASASGMLPFSAQYDLGLAKASIAPTISVSDVTWDGDLLTVHGQVSDADGEAVVLSLSVDSQPGGTVSVVGSNWQTDEINMRVFGTGNHTISVTACDESDVCTTITHTEDATQLFDTGGQQVVIPIKDDSDDDGLLPAPSFIFTLLGMLGAAMICSRRR
jgi:hypothetical protein